MKRYRPRIKDGLWTTLILVAAFIINQMIQMTFETQKLIPMIFVLGIFLIALKTEGYLWGITASLVSVVAVNYAFTYPYYTFDFLWPESIFSTAVMLIVAIMTSTLTTKIKAQEKAHLESEKEKMRANLLRAISHDLRTPLTSIYGSTSVIIENYDTLNKEHHIRFLEEIQEDAEWLIRMVENLLSVTRIAGNSEQVRVRKTPTVLEELIDAVLMKFKKRYPEQAVAVAIPEEFISIPMDAMLIEQVLFNCLENAVHHAEGMTELSLSVSKKGASAVFEIADNGCGIPHDRLDKLFTGYLERGNTPADGTRNNMGIGLSACAAIIRAHGGTMQAENRREGGAVFRFALEMEVAEDGQ